MEETCKKVEHVVPERLLQLFLTLFPPMSSLLERDFEYREEEGSSILKTTSEYGWICMKSPMGREDHLEVTIFDFLESHYSYYEFTSMLDAQNQLVTDVHYTALDMKFTPVTKKFEKHYVFSSSGDNDLLTSYTARSYERLEEKVLYFPFNVLPYFEEDRDSDFLPYLKNEMEVSVDSMNQQICGSFNQQIFQQPIDGNRSLVEQVDSVFCSEQQKIYQK